jgi:Cdc6-like AAA superfamily ATPase
MPTATFSAGDVMPTGFTGCEDALAAAVLALERTARGRYARSLLFTGLCGVGKTVLLREIHSRAHDRGYLTELLEARAGESLNALLIPALRRMLLDLNQGVKAGEAVKRALRVLRGFLGKVKIGADGFDWPFDVDPEAGRADSGNFEDDFADVLVAVGEAAQAATHPVAILIDELQNLAKDDLSALMRGLHAVNQENLPLLLFGAGLPQLVGQAGDAKSYAERLFSFVTLDRLGQQEA